MRRYRTLFFMLSISVGFYLAGEGSSYRKELETFAFSDTGRLYSAIRWENAWRILLEAELWVRAVAGGCMPSRSSGLHGSLIQSCAAFGAVCPRASDMPLLYQKIAAVAAQESIQMPLVVVSIPAPSSIAHCAQSTRQSVPLLFLAGTEVMMRSSAEVDFVIGHQLAHLSLRHGRMPFLSSAAVALGVVALGALVGHGLSRLAPLVRPHWLATALTAGVLGAGGVALHAYALRRREYAADARALRYAPAGARIYFAPERCSLYRQVVQPSVTAARRLLQSPRFALLSEPQRQFFLALLERELRAYGERKGGRGLFASHPSAAQRHAAVKKRLKSGVS